jgi:tetratricopeptide (TPR) repeat protein
MPTEPKISLCMIVRDEEASLARCLASAKPFVDEICIVDTGSVDGTLEIARSFGARVASVPWNDSFAEARNHSLEMASGDWVLVLDGDEALAPESGVLLRRLARTPNLLGALGQLVDHVDGSTHSNWVLRFFRNAPEHRFVGVIHNQLAPAFHAQAERLGLRLVLEDGFRIDHWGYSSDARAKKKKHERTLRLYERALREEPDNVFMRYKHADFVRGLGEPERALAALDDVCARVRALPPAERAAYAWCGEAFALYALELLVAGRTDEAMQQLDHATYCPPTANLCFVFGLWCLRTEQWDAALQAFVDCRSITGPARIQAPAPGVVTWKAALGMTEALIGAGRKHEAVELALHETQAHPESHELWVRAVQLQAEHESAERALELCRRGLERHPGQPLLSMLLAELLLAQGEASAALVSARAALASAPPENLASAQALLTRCVAAQTGREQAAASGN